MSWQNKKIIFKVLVWCGVYSAVGGLWKILDYIFYGYVVPSYEDTIMAIIISFLIFKLLMRWITFGD